MTLTLSLLGQGCQKIWRMMKSSQHWEHFPPNCYCKRPFFHLPRQFTAGENLKVAGDITSHWHLLKTLPGVIRS